MASRSRPMEWPTLRRATAFERWTREGMSLSGRSGQPGAQRRSESASHEIGARETVGARIRYARPARANGERALVVDEASQVRLATPLERAAEGTLLAAAWNGTGTQRIRSPTKVHGGTAFLLLEGMTTQIAAVDLRTGDAQSMRSTARARCVAWQSRETARRFT